MSRQPYPADILTFFSPCGRERLRSYAPSSWGMLAHQVARDASVQRHHSTRNKRLCAAEGAGAQLLGPAGQGDQQVHAAHAGSGGLPGAAHVCGRLPAQGGVLHMPQTINLTGPVQSAELQWASCNALHKAYSSRLLAGAGPQEAVDSWPAAAASFHDQPRLPAWPVCTQAGLWRVCVPAYDFSTGIADAMV